MLFRLALHQALVLKAVCHSFRMGHLKFILLSGDRQEVFQAKPAHILGMSKKTLELTLRTWGFLNPQRSLLKLQVDCWA